MNYQKIIETNIFSKNDKCLQQIFGHVQLEATKILNCNLNIFNPPVGERWDGCVSYLLEVLPNTMKEDEDFEFTIQWMLRYEQQVFYVTI